MFLGLKVSRGLFCKSKLFWKKYMNNRATVQNTSPLTWMDLNCIYHLDLEWNLNDWEEYLNCYEPVEKVDAGIKKTTTKKQKQNKTMI